MNAAQLLRLQYDGIHSLFAEAVSGISAAEWRSRPYPGTNRVGFAAWHMPRTQDWALNTCVLGRAEVADRPEFGALAAAAPGIGVGISLAEADAVAELVTSQQVLDYEAAVHEQLVAWVTGLGDADLDRVPPSEANQALKAAYLAPAMRPEVEDLFGKPVWRFANNPANGHVRIHLGELRAALEAIRRTAEPLPV